MEVVGIAGKIGRLCCKSEAGNGRSASQSIGQSLEKGLGFFRGVAVTHRIDVEEGHGLRVEVGLNAVVLDDGKDEEPGNQEEQERASDLRSHGEIAQPEVLVAGKLKSRALLERRGDVGI